MSDDDIQKGLEIGAQIARNMLAKKLAHLPVASVKGLLAEHDLRQSKTNEDIRKALSTLNPNASAEDLIEDLGAEIVQLDASARAEDYELNKNRLAALNDLGKRATAEHIKSLWVDHYEGEDPALAKAFGAGPLQQVFQKVAGVKDDGAVSHPDLFLHAFRHFILLSKPSLPAKFIEDNDALEDFYILSLLSSTAFLTANPTIEDVSPIQTYEGYHKMAQLAPVFAEGFDQRKRAGFSLLVKAFGQKAAAYQQDFEARVEKATSNSGLEGEELGLKVRAALTKPAPLKR